MKKRIKKYRPKPIVPMLGFAYAAWEAVGLKMMPHVAFDNLMEGSAQDEDIATILVRLDFGYVLYKTIFKENIADECLLSAFGALQSIQHRTEELGECKATESELVVIGDALNAVDDIQDNTTRREHWNALNKVKEMRTKLRQRTN